MGSHTQRNQFWSQACSSLQHFFGFPASGRQAGLGKICFGWAGRARLGLDTSLTQTTVDPELDSAGAQYDKSVSNGQKLIFHPLISEYKNTPFGFFVTFYDVIDHI